MVINYRQERLVKSSYVDVILSSAVGIEWPSERCLIDRIAVPEIAISLGVVLDLPLHELHGVADRGDSKNFLSKVICELVDFFDLDVTSCLELQSMEWEHPDVRLQGCELNVLHVGLPLIYDEVIFAVSVHLDILAVKTWDLNQLEEGLLLIFIQANHI